MEKKEFRFLPLIICIAIPLLSGIIVGLLTQGSMDVYETVTKPPFAPPAILFPIVWGILYSLMGVSLYLIYSSGGGTLNYAIFAAQLAANLLWPFIFFNAQAFTAAFIILIILWILVLLMILIFRKTSPAAAYLQIPYLLWLTFAGVLNLYIVLNN